MVDRPLFTDPATGFADWFEAASSAVTRALHDATLPPPSMVWVTTDAVGVYPWSIYGTASALLAWAEHLAEVTWRTESVDYGTKIVGRGRLYGVPCELQGTTHRHVPAEVDDAEDAVRHLAAEEGRA
ncbi:hypothetical protein [Pseudonocardia sp. D17]|uniref:hypothetical protein n=1 Tax=Pseudonocardia sp. D17 TaxID=882661 RepID=UPI002B367B6E|nr:hypothetical protein PSD17_56720 [Pseudonocardia sp. D17]